MVPKVCRTVALVSAMVPYVSRVPRVTPADVVTPRTWLETLFTLPMRLAMLPVVPPIPMVVPKTLLSLLVIVATFVAVAPKLRNVVMVGTSMGVSPLVPLMTRPNALVTSPTVAVILLGGTSPI